MKQKFAVFDIDGTLIRWQLYHALVDRLAKAGTIDAKIYEHVKNARMIWKRREFPEAFKSYEDALIGAYESALHKLGTDTFDRLVTSVIDEYKDQVYTYTRNLAKESKNKGLVLLAISGSHHELIEQLGLYYGFDDWVGTRYTREGQKFTGEKIVGSKNKKAVLETMVSKHNLTYTGSIAIGDSRSDISMLELVEQPIAFNPDSNLYKIARQSGWKIVVERKNVIYELNSNQEKYELT